MYRDKKKYKLNGFFAFFIVLNLIVCFACLNKEESARKMYKEAMTLQHQGYDKEALEKYKKIVEKYPETQTAIKATGNIIAYKCFY